MRRYRHTTPIKTASPIIRRLFELIDAQDITYKDIGRRAGISANSLPKWRSGRVTPNIVSIEIIAEVVGLKLCFTGAVVTHDQQSQGTSR